MKIVSLISSLFLAIPTFADVVLYTDRPTARMQVIADMYAKAGGDNIIIKEMKAPEIMSSIKASGSSSDADVIFVKDGVYLNDLKNQNMLSAFSSSDIVNNTDASLRDGDNMWTFITARARTLVYDDSVDVSAINSYADLADPKWAGTMCLRTSKSSYNEGLVAALIANYGSQKASDIVKGILANRAQPTVYKDDTSILNAIAGGECAFGIANSYYLGILLSQQPGLPVKIKFLNTNNNGVHMNGTGAGIAAVSKQKDKAEKFLAFMLTDAVQLFITGEQFDFPAKKGLVPNTLVKDFGSYTKDTTNWKSIGAKITEAIQLMKDLSYE